MELFHQLCCLEKNCSNVAILASVHLNSRVGVEMKMRIQLHKGIDSYTKGSFQNLMINEYNDLDMILNASPG